MSRIAAFAARTANEARTSARLAYAGIRRDLDNAEAWLHRYAADPQCDEEDKAAIERAHEEIARERVRLPCAA
jgi:hypothetical protein